ATLLGSMTRVVGGWLSDKFGGINALYGVFIVTVGALGGLASSPTLGITVTLFMISFAALGAGNGALFQLVPMRWPLSTAIAGSMIGEIGALGGGILPNVLGQSRQRTGSFGAGFAAYAAFTFVMMIMLYVVSRKWTRTWVGAGGRVLMTAPEESEAVVSGEGLLTTT
ncbi:MAG: MFS transporter, partial [Acidobacteriaceae bacterium]